MAWGLELRKARVVELPLTPGALSDDTDLAAKLHAVDMDKVRSRGNRWETIKGWSAFNASGMTAGKARGMHTWAALDGTPVAIAASESAVNAWVDGTRFTVTPKLYDVFIHTDNVAFDNNSMIVTWALYDPVAGTSAAATQHFLEVGDSVTISGLVTTMPDGGDYNPNSTFTIASIPTPTTFTLTTSGTAPNDEVGAFNLTVAFRAGLATGTGDAIEEQTRVYSFSNFGENAVFCGSDGTPIWYWQPSTSYAELITDGGFPDLTNWTQRGGATGWGASGGKAVHTGGTPGDISQLISDILVGGKTYEISFTLSSVGAGFSLSTFIDTIPIRPTISQASVTSTTANQTYTSRFVCPADPQYLVFTGDGSVSIDDVSVKLLSTAHPITEAPFKNNALFVDGNHVLSALGSVEADGDYNPLLWRWCAQDNYREWIPDTDNIAGELILGVGSRAVCGEPVGDVSLILSDDAAFSGIFTATGYALTLLGTGCGGVGAGCVATFNNSAFWASKRGFHSFNGAQVLPITCPVKDRYVGKLAQYQENKTFAWMNVEYGEVWWHYPHTDDGTETSRYLIYNVIAPGNPWSFGTLNRTSMVRSSVFHYPIGIDASGNIWSHEYGAVFSGSGIVLPFIETGYITGGDGDRWMGCRRYYPDVENQTGNILLTVIGKRAPQGQHTTQTIGPLFILPDQRTVDFLLSARQLKFRWESAETPTMWRLGVVGLEVVSERERR